jgi:hypothetical protein
MKRYFAAYEPVSTESILVFTVVVRDEMVARQALLAMRGACPNLRWTERTGFLENEIPPQPPFEFLPTAV